MQLQISFVWSTASFICDVASDEAIESCKNNKTIENSIIAKQNNKN